MKFDIQRQPGSGRENFSSNEDLHLPITLLDQQQLIRGAFEKVLACVKDLLKQQNVPLFDSKKQQDYKSVDQTIAAVRRVIHEGDRILALFEDDLSDQASQWRQLPPAIIQDLYTREFAGAFIQVINSRNRAFAKRQFEPERIGETKRRAGKAECLTFKDLPACADAMADAFKTIKSRYLGMPKSLAVFANDLSLGGFVFQHLSQRDIVNILKDLKILIPQAEGSDKYIITDDEARKKAFLARELDEEVEQVIREYAKLS
jgi:hypothetical protein